MDLQRHRGPPVIIQVTVLVMFNLKLRDFWDAICHMSDQCDFHSTPHVTSNPKLDYFLPKLKKETAAEGTSARPKQCGK